MNNGHFSSQMQPGRNQNRIRSYYIYEWKLKAFSWGISRRLPPEPAVTAGASDADAAQFGEANLGGFHAVCDDGEGTLENLRSEKRVGMAGGSQGGAIHTERFGALAGADLEEGVAVVQEG